jgi:hypothetical protein
VSFKAPATTTLEGETKREAFERRACTCTFPPMERDTTQPFRLFKTNCIENRQNPRVRYVPGACSVGMSFAPAKFKKGR